MTITDPKTSRVLVTVLLFAAVLLFVWRAHTTIIAFLFAVFFAYLIEPLVEFASKRAKVSRGWGIAIVYVAIFSGLCILFLSIGPNIVREAQTLSSTIPGVYQKIVSGQIAWTLGTQHGWSYHTNQQIQQFLATHRDAVLNAARAFAARLAEVGKNAWWLVVIPILAVFFLKDGRLIRDSVVDTFERRKQRALVEAVIEDVNTMLAQFIRAQLILAGLTGVVFSVVLTLMRVPYGYVLGVIAGFLEFIPVVGPIFAAILIAGLAIGIGYKHVLLLVLFLGAWRVVQDYVNSPRIMGKQVELHPLAALFGVLAGAEVGGVIGVYLSIPIMASLRIIWRRWRGYAGSDLAADRDIIAISEASPHDRTA